MPQIKLECQVLTPLFLGGADSRLNPELRAPSIRGAMRYWYRALLGGSTFIRGKDELLTLRENEARVFGTTEHSSAVTVRVTYDTEPVRASFQKDRAIRTSDGGFLPTGKDYLLWSMAATRQLPDREYIKPDTKFAITLGARQDVVALKAATASFWLLANLGALGARANRGAGSIQAQQVDWQSDEIAFRVCQSIDELQTYLTNGIRQCLAAIGDGKAEWRAFKDTQPSYDVITPDAAQIWIVANAPGGWSSFSDALNGIGEKMRDYRSYRKTVGRADHDAVLQWLEEGGASPQIKRAAFGLPIPFRYSDGGPSDVIQAEGSERRASPLRVRITRLITGKYVGVLTLFQSRFLEEGKSLMLQTRKRKVSPPTNYKVIEDFIQTFELKRSVEL